MAEGKARVRVNSKNIQWALTQSSSHCAIAQALIDLDDSITYPRVTQEEIRFTDRQTGERKVYKTPKRVAKWIDEWDRNPEGVSPMSFDLDLSNPDIARPVRRAQPSERVAESLRKKRKPVVQAGPPRNYRPLRGEE